MSSLNNSSKPMTSRPGWARPQRPWLPGSQQRSQARDACRRQLAAMTDLRCGRRLESAISRTAAAISAPPTISTNPRMLDCWIHHASSRRSTRRPCRRSLAVPQEVNQSTKSNRSGSFVCIKYACVLRKITLTIFLQ